MELKMARYRIVKMKGYSNQYRVEQKWFIFWITRYDFLSLNTAEQYIKLDMETDKEKRENPKNIVVKEF